MFLQLGLAAILIWFLNWAWMIWQILRYTPNWRDNDIDSDQIATNFVVNAPEDLIEFFAKVATGNPYLGMVGVVFIMLSFIM